jgi:hypothetical protein
MFSSVTRYHSINFLSFILRYMKHILWCISVTVITELWFKILKISPVWQWFKLDITDSDFQSSILYTGTDNLKNKPQSVCL